VTNGIEPASGWVRKFRGRMLGVTAAFWLACFVGTHIPASRLVPLGVKDKTLHLSGYAAMAAMLAATMWAYGWPRRKRLLGAATMIPAYAALDEITQPLVNRCADVADWTADMIGAAAAVTAFETLILFVNRRQNAGSP
jgi:VanZ family protein